MAGATRRCLLSRPGARGNAIHIGKGARYTDNDWIKTFHRETALPAEPRLGSVEFGRTLLHTTAGAGYRLSDDDGR